VVNIGCRSHREPFSGFSARNSIHGQSARKPCPIRDGDTLVVARVGPRGSRCTGYCNGVAGLGAAAYDPEDPDGTAEGQAAKTLARLKGW